MRREARACLEVLWPEPGGVSFSARVPEGSAVGEEQDAASYSGGR